MIKDYRKRKMAYFISLAMLCSIFLVTSCAKKEDNSEISSVDNSIVITENTKTSEILNAKELALLPLKSVAPAEVKLGNIIISNVEYDFYYYNAYQNIATVTDGENLPLDANNMFDKTQKTNIPGLETITWDEYFASEAEKEIKQVYILEKYGSENGIEKSQNAIQQASGFIAAAEPIAQKKGQQIDEYLKSTYGEFASREAFLPILEKYFYAHVDCYQSFLNNIVLSEEQLNNYYQINAGTLDDTDLATVRHILFMAPKGAPNFDDATPEETALAKERAQTAFDSIGTIDDMIRIGAEAKADQTAAEVAEYKDLKPDQMASIEPFNAWCFDPSRQPNDKAIVETMFGYHVVYFIEFNKAWKNEARSKLKDESYNQFLEEKYVLPEYSLTLTP